MNIKKYFWGLNPTALKETERIIKNPEHPRFIERIFAILSRCDKPKELFSIIKKEQFIETWPKIRQYWIKRNQAKDFRFWWETIYEQLAEKGEIRKKLKGRPSEIFIKIGKIIREKRLDKGLSQTDLARMARIKQPDISKIESGKINITLETLLRLCKILDIKELSLMN